MTVTRQNNFEGGRPGAVITNGNSGGASGDAYGVAWADTGLSRTYTSTNPIHGSVSGHVVAPHASGGAAFIGWDNLFTGKTVVLRVYIRFNADTSMAGTQTITLTSHTSNSVVGLRLAPGFSLSVVSEGKAVSGTKYAVKQGLVYRVELLATPDGATSRLKYGLYAGDSTTALVGPVDVSNANMSGPISGVRIGRAGTTGDVNITVDSIAASDERSEFFGPVGLSLVVDAGINQSDIEPGRTVALTGSVTSGIVSSVAWRQVSGTPKVNLSGSTNHTATYAAPANLSGATLVFGFTATNSIGSSEEATVENRVLYSTDRVIRQGAEIPLIVSVNRK